MSLRAWWASRAERERRLLGYAALVMSPIVAWVWVLQPLTVSVGQARRDVETARWHLESERQAIHRLRADSMIRAVAEQLSREKAARLFVDSAGDGGLFGEYVADLVNDAGIGPELTDHAMDSSTAPLSIAAATLRFRGTLADLVTLLTLVDEDQKWLNVPHLVVRAEESYRAPHGRDSTGRLAISMVVQGLSPQVRPDREHR